MDHTATGHAKGSRTRTASASHGDTWTAATPAQVPLSRPEKPREAAAGSLGGRGRWLARVAAGLMLACGLAAAPAAWAQTFTGQVTSTPTTVNSGDNITWTVSWACNGTSDCTGATINVPLPVGQPTELQPVLGVTTTADAGGKTTSPSGAAGFVTNGGVTSAYWQFVTLHPGDSGAVTFTIKTRNEVTPDGTIYTPTVTYATSTASTPMSGTSVNVHSTAAFTFTKTLYAPQEGGTPYLDTDVTYAITFAPNPFLYAPNGTWFPQKVVINDQLPAGATFVQAKYVSTYQDPSTPPSGTCTPVGNPVTAISCPPLLGVPMEGQNGPVMTVYVTVHYTSTANGGTFTTSSTPTNSATADITKWGQTAVSTTLSASKNHALQAYVQPTTNPLGLQKLAYDGIVNVHPGEQGKVFGTDLTNKTYVPAGFTLTDNVPCLSTLTSPLGNNSCASGDLAMLMTDFVFPSFTVYPLTINYTLNDGSTGSAVNDLNAPNAGVNGNGPATNVTPGTPHQFTAPAGKYFTRLTYSGQLAANEHYTVLQYFNNPSTLPTTLPGGITYQNTANAANTPYLENCFSGLSYASPPGTTATDVSMTGGTGCVDWEIRKQAPVIYVLKGTADSPTAVGGVVKFSLTVLNWSSATAPLNPWMADLLPANLSLVPNSAQWTQVPSGFDTSQALIEYLPAYNGGTRDLLRVSFPPVNNVRQVLNPNSPDWGSPKGYLSLQFSATVRDGTPPGTYPNNGLYSDAVDPNNLYCGDRYYPLNTADTQNLYGNGPQQMMCGASSTYQVLETPAMGAIKAAQGDQNTAMVAAPGTATATTSAVILSTLTNTGNKPLNLVGYDILPYVGDTFSALGNTTPRGSAWQPVFNGMGTLPAGVTVYYSTDPNPCRGEVAAAGGAPDSWPVGCSSSAWSTTPPSSLASVRALRFTADNVAGGASLPIPFNVLVPAGTAPNSIAYSSVALAGRDINSGAYLQPTETAKVGLTYVPAPAPPTPTAKPTPVPSLQGWALTAMGLMLLALGARQARLRR